MASPSGQVSIQDRQERRIQELEFVVTHLQKTVDDLNIAMRRSDLTVEQRQALQYVSKQASQIGQVSERAYTEERMVVSTSYGGFVSAIPEVVRHYTVCRKDLLSYPAKVAQQHQCWA